MNCKSLKNIVFVGLLLVSTFRALGQGVDYSHLYNPNAELSVDHQLVNEDGGLALFFAFTIKNRSYQLYDYTFELYSCESYNDELSTPIDKSSYDSVYLESNNTVNYLK